MIQDFIITIFSLLLIALFGVMFYIARESIYDEDEKNKTDDEEDENKTEDYWRFYKKNQ